jgi:hypothetical protein
MCSNVISLFQLINLTKIYLFPIITKKRGQEQCPMHIISATWKAKTGGSQLETSLVTPTIPAKLETEVGGPQSKASTGKSVRPYLK